MIWCLIRAAITWACSFQVTSVGRELGLGFLGTGLDPLTATADVPAVPKATFALYR